MPLLKHAKKKQRQDKKRTDKNRVFKTLLRSLVKTAKTSKAAEDISAAFSSIDKAAKNHILHKNKAARMKSSLSKLDASVVVASPKKTTTEKKAPKKTTAKKTVTKKKTK